MDCCAWEEDRRPPATRTQALAGLEEADGLGEALRLLPQCSPGGGAFPGLGVPGTG